MRKTKIEWCDYSLNPVKGLCPMACTNNQGKEYCYARRMYKRFKWNLQIRYDHTVFAFLDHITKPSKIFVGSTMELFGDWVSDWVMDNIFNTVRSYSEHIFIFLTKQPGNLINRSPFPDNCWIGVSITGKEPSGFAYPLVHLKVKVKFISFEPLLDSCIKDIDSFSRSLETSSINWVIIGQQTPISKCTEPKTEWIKEIVEAADKAKIPIFLKNNLYSVFGKEHRWAFNPVKASFLRQEYPDKGG